MPYNSDATRTTILDSSVGRYPASRPHQKLTPTCRARRDSVRVRQTFGLVIPKFTFSLTPSMLACTITHQRLAFG